MLFAGCSNDVVVAPMKAPMGPLLSVSAANDRGDYILQANGKGFGADFTAKVAAAGGVVIYSNSKVGFASVSGLTPSAATQLGAVTGLSVQADATVMLDSPAAVFEEDLGATAESSAQSQANPAGALRGFFQWNMHLIGADSVWKLAQVESIPLNSSLLGDSTVTVAILDTGIDYDNRDFFNTTTGVRLVDLNRSTSFVPSDDAISASMFPSRNVLSDFHGHGTNVATQVSSLAFALAGVTSKTKLIGVKVLNAQGSGSLGGVLSGVLWAADHGANIANMSLGGAFAKAGNGRLVSLINRVFNYAKQQGMLIVVSAGNALPPDFVPVDIQHNGNQFQSYCDAPHVICVSAVGPLTYDALHDPPFVGDVPAWYSYYGRSVISVAGPGGNSGDVFSTWPWGFSNGSPVWSFCSRQRLVFSAEGVPALAGCQAGGTLRGYLGTSQAAPHVSGLAALLIAKYGHLSPQALKKRIEETGDPIDPAYGRSRINVLRALGL